MHNAQQWANTSPINSLPSEPALTKFLSAGCHELLSAQNAVRPWCCQQMNELIRSPEIAVSRISWMVEVMISAGNSLRVLALGSAGLSRCQPHFNQRISTSSPSIQLSLCFRKWLFSWKICKIIYRLNS